jgi:UDP-glucuronate decarboxylase
MLSTSHSFGLHLSIDYMQRKKILITGGAGFLGSHLCEALLSFDHEVICVDDFSTGSKDNILHLLDHPRFSFIEHDVCRMLFMDVNEIYNLACPASPVQYQKDPIHTLKTSVLGACNLLELARKNRAKILQASTSEIYGDPLCHPQQENYWGNVNPIGVRSCYDEGKRCAETLFFDYHRKFNLPIKIARIFNTYGPKMHPQDGRAVCNFFTQAVKGEPLTIFGDGSHTRSFCYVTDMVDGLIALMNSDDQITGPINLGNPEECTIKELALMIQKLTKTNAKLTYLPLPQDDPKQRKPDITQAMRKLRWQPCVSLLEGLTQTAPFFQKITEEKELVTSSYVG